MSSPFKTLPPNWQRTRLDRVATVKARIGWRALTASEYQPEGYVFLATPNIKSVDIDFDNVNYISKFRYFESPELILEEGDVLLVKDGNTLGITNLVRSLPRPATVNGSIAVIRCHSMEPRFLRYVLDSSVVQGLIGSVKDGMGVPHLFQRDINRFPLPSPSLLTQQAIADYLDTETARIDALTTKKRHLIKLLEERAQADLLESIGDWRTGSRTLRQYGASVLTGPFGTVLSADEYVDGQVPLVNPTHIRSGRIFPEYEVTVTTTVAERIKRHRLAVGDIVMGRKGDVGRSAIVTPKEEGWICGSDSIAIRCSPELLASYLAMALRLDLYRQQLARSSTGAMVAGVNEPTLMQFRLPFVDLEAQEAAVLQGTVTLSRLEASVKLLSRQVGLMEEHRQALVTATVTGELEVPGVAA